MILDVQSLNVNYKTYFGAVSALRDVNLQIKEQMSLGIIGESGSGKSTLAYAIMNYLDANGQADGQVLYHGENLLGKNDREMAELRGNKIAMVFQNPYSSLNPSLTIGYQLDEVTRFHRNLNRQEARKQSISILKDMNLGDAEGLVKRFPHQISGGMQQRISIAMALLCRPDLMILDEPTTALDVTTEAVILDLINSLKERYNMSMIYISHDMGVVNKVSDRIAVMYRGEMVEYGEQTTIFKNPKHPYTRALINCIPRSGIISDEYRLNTIPGYVKSRSIDEGGCPFIDRCVKKTPTCENDYGMLLVDTDHYSACSRAYATDVEGDYNVIKKTNPKTKTSPPPEEEKELLKVNRLFKTFHTDGKKLHAVDGIDYSLAINNVLGIVGESGCGKSTLGYTLAGLLKASKGKIVYNGKNLNKTWSHRSMDTLREIQLIFQNPARSLNPYFTIEESIGRPMKRLLGIKSKEERRKKIIEMLQSVDLGQEYLQRKVSQLSGGEIQRVAVARAFVLSPKLIICDEPTSAMDVSVQASVLNLLTDLKQKNDCSYIFISHDLNVVNYISDYIMVMYRGRIVEFGKQSEVIVEPWHPYTQALLSAIPDVDPSIKKEHIRLYGPPPNPSKKIKGCPFSNRCHKKIGPICDSIAPEPIQMTDTHTIACHHMASDESIEAMTKSLQTKAPARSLLMKQRPPR